MNPQSTPQDDNQTIFPTTQDTNNQPIAPTDNQINPLLNKEEDDFEPQRFERF